MTEGWDVRRMRCGRPWLTNAVLCGLGLALLLLTRDFVSEYDHFSIGFSGASGWSVWVYLAAALVVITQPKDRWTFRIVIGFAVALQMTTLFMDPLSSTDIYRYVWDGIVQHTGINPYRFVPGNAALSFLREPYQDIFDNINRRDYAVTIYPPVAQMVYWLVTFFSPTVTAMKAAMVGFEGLTAWALVKIFDRVGRPRTDVLLFAWFPLLAWEIGGAGHVDAAVFCFIALAILFRVRGQDGWTGFFLGLAIFTKFYPFILIPALYRRRDWKMPAAIVAVGVVGYALYSSVGWRVFGFLSGYDKEEGIDSGQRFFLLDYANHHAWGRWLTVHGYLLVCALVLGSLAWWAWRHASREDVPARARLGQQPAVFRACVWLGLAMMLLFSPHYPWYVAWLLPLIALAPDVAAITYVCTLFYALTTRWADPGPKMFLLNEWLYGTVAMALVVGAVLRRWPVLRYFFCEGDGPARSSLGTAPQDGTS